MKNARRGSLETTTPLGRAATLSSDAAPTERNRT
jgi:hypothetical protein